MEPRTNTPRLVLLLPALLMLLLEPSAGLAAPFTISCPPTPDVDVGAGGVFLQCTSPTSGIIEDLDVYLDIGNAGGGSTYASDLHISLTHVASNTTVEIYLGAAPQAPTSIIQALFDDDSLNGTAPTSGDAIGNFVPNDPFSAFNSLEVGGADNWVLHIEDISTWPGEGHDLLQWDIIVLTPEPGTGVLVGIGLIGLVILGGDPRRRRDRKPF